MTSMFEHLMELPLFRGVSLTRMAQVVGQAKFHFLKYPAGETLIRAGEPCTHLTCIISGHVRSTIVNDNGRFAVAQTLTSPAILSPEFLFGRRTTHPADVEAIDDVSVLKISKNDFVNIINSDEVFLFNYLNILSVSAQKSVEGILALTNGSLGERIAFWIVALTQPDGRDITMQCRMRDLCAIFGVQRAVFDASLSALSDEGILRYDLHTITVLDRQRLAALLFRAHE